MTKYLTKKQILDAQDIKREEVKVPEWGGAVMVRGLTGAERDQFEASVVQFRGSNVQTNMADVRAKLAAMAICDESGEALFSADDVKALSQKSAAALQRVYNVAARLSGITDEDVDELAKNSASAQNGASGSV